MSIQEILIKIRELEEQLEKTKKELDTYKELLSQII